jgi:ligand-binding sensor domain-containing protein
MPRQFILSLAATVTCGWWLGVLDSSRCAASEPLAEADYFVQSWQTDEGLPGNAVTDVLQDQKGYLWLATIGGLVRFDGATFKTLVSPLIARMAARNIRTLAETADGTLLMLPAVGGVVQMKAGQFSAHPAGEGLAGKPLLTLFVDPGGAIWLGMQDGEVRRWQDGKISDFAPTNGLKGNTRVSFAADGDGRVWLASGVFFGQLSRWKTDAVER